jgi:hypothetical protein
MPHEPMPKENGNRECHSKEGNDEQFEWPEIVGRWVASAVYDDIGTGEDERQYGKCGRQTPPGVSMPRGPNGEANVRSDGQKAKSLKHN